MALVETIQAGDVTPRLIGRTVRFSKSGILRIGKVYSITASNYTAGKPADSVAISITDEGWRRTDAVELDTPIEVFEIVEPEDGEATS